MSGQEEMKARMELGQEEIKTTASAFQEMMVAQENTAMSTIKKKVEVMINSILFELEETIEKQVEHTLMSLRGTKWEN
jgi:hypothetical protein